MDAPAPRGLLAYFQDLDDPRGPRIRHRLEDRLTIAMLAVICEARGWVEVELFGQSKAMWLRTFLALPHGIPSHDTFGYAFHETIEEDHGRIETRRCGCVWEVRWLRRHAKWPGLLSVVCVESTRELIDPAGGVSQASVQRRYDLGSRDGRSAKAALGWARGHGAVENNLHGCLDVSFDEDACCLRQGHSAQNLSRLRCWALNLLKIESTTKAGIKAKRLKCGWNHDYLLKVLTHTP